MAEWPSVSVSSVQFTRPARAEREKRLALQTSVSEEIQTVLLKFQVSDLAFRHSLPQSVQAAVPQSYTLVAPKNRG